MWLALTPTLSPGERGCHGNVTRTAGVSSREFGVGPSHSRASTSCKRWMTVPLSPGERAGVRASQTHFLVMGGGQTK